MNKHLKYFFILAILMILLSGCGEESPTAQVQVSEDSTFWPTNGWRTSTPEEQGIDSAKLVDLIEHIQQMRYDVDSIVIILFG